MSAFLHRQGVHAMAADIERVMEPLHPTLAYANSRCTVGSEVYEVYAGKRISSPNCGLSSGNSGSASGSSGSVGVSSVSSGGNNDSDRGSATNSGRSLNAPASSPSRDGRTSQMSNYRGVTPVNDFPPASSTPSPPPPTMKSALVPASIAAAAAAAEAVCQNPAGSIVSESGRSHHASRQTNVSPTAVERNRRRHMIAAADSDQGNPRVVRNSPLEPWQPMTHHGGSAACGNGIGSNSHEESTGGYDNNVGSGATNSGGGHGHQPDTLESQLFMTRFGQGAAGVSPVPAAASSLSTLSLDDVSGLHRPQIMFDLGAQPQAFDVEGRNNPFIGGNFTLAPTGMGGARHEGASAGVQHLPSSTGMPSESSSSRPSASVDSDRDSNHATIIRGMLSM